MGRKSAVFASAVAVVGTAALLHGSRDHTGADHVVRVLGYELRIAAGVRRADPPELARARSDVAPRCTPDTLVIMRPAQ